MGSFIVTRFTKFLIRLPEYLTRTTRIANQHTRYHDIVSEAHFEAALTAWEYASANLFPNLHVSIAIVNLKKCLNHAHGVKAMTEYRFICFGPYEDPSNQYVTLERMISAAMLLVQAFDYVENAAEMKAALAYTQEAFARYCELVAQKKIYVPVDEFGQMKTDIAELTEYVSKRLKQLPPGGK